MADKYVKLDDVIDTLENEWGYEGMREDLDKLPTADVVEVVRCKDCKHKDELTISEKFYYKKGCVACTSVRSLGKRVVRSADDYCSYGERKMRGNESVYV